MRVVVTGATGNVGSRLLPQLLADPAVTSVVGVARRLPVERDARVEWRSLDLRDEDVRPVLRGADVVVHLAWWLQPAHAPDAMRKANVGATKRLLDAFVAEGVPALVHASSIGAYSPAPDRRAVDESYPTGGFSTSHYSRHKSAAERLLDELERRHPERRVVRLRKALVLQGDMASAGGRYLLGPLVPQRLVRRSLLPVLPLPRGLVLQAVHTEDAATAYRLAVTRPVTGPFNIAAEPVLTPEVLADALGARWVPVPDGAARAAVSALWHLRLQPTDPGWVDLALGVPVLRTDRARDELGWRPTRSATDAVREVVDGLGRNQGAPTPVLEPRSGGPKRLLEVLRMSAPGPWAGAGSDLTRLRRSEPER